jgi:hypothetical protein
MLPAPCGKVRVQSALRAISRPDQGCSSGLHESQGDMHGRKIGGGSYNLQANGATNKLIGRPSAKHQWSDGRHWSEAQPVVPGTVRSEQPAVPSEPPYAAELQRLEAAERSIAEHERSIIDLSAALHAENASKLGAETASLPPCLSSRRARSVQKLPRTTKKRVMASATYTPMLLIRCWRQEIFLTCCQALLGRLRYF